MINTEFIKKLNSIIEPKVNECGYKLYYLEFVTEQKENFLRLYIENINDENINLDDCEKVSRQISDILDIEDPIEDSYYLEVCSPGINRFICTNEHLKRYLEHDISIKLNKTFRGSKKFDGKLNSFDNSGITIIYENEKEIKIPREKIKSINLSGEI